MIGQRTSIEAEIGLVEELLRDLPLDEIISRASLESRLAGLKGELANFTHIKEPTRFTLTFRGQPVEGSHGIQGDFGGVAIKSFSDTFAAFVAGIKEKISDAGPIADRSKHPLLLTNVATGSFGFEFELSDGDVGFFTDGVSVEERAVSTIKDFMRSAAEEGDEKIADLVESVHPRVVRKLTDFLEEMKKWDSWCGIEIGGDYFRYSGIEEVDRSILRLREDNIVSDSIALDGEFTGVLPYGRSFEFKPIGEAVIVRGRISREIQDPDILNRDYLHVPLSVTFKTVRVGQSKPRYSLEQLGDISRR